MTTGLNPHGTAESEINRLEIGPIVSELRALRVASLEHRQRLNKPPKLPSRKTLATIIERLSAALFPNRLGAPGISDEGIDYYVGYTLDTTLRDLLDQIQHELFFVSGQEVAAPSLREQAAAITSTFAKQLPKIRNLLENDIRAAYEGDPAAHSVDDVLVCYPGVIAIIHYRIAHELNQLGAPLIARMISEIAHSLTGIEIHPGAQIGDSFFIDHGTGVVIGETTIIGRNVRHPIVEDDVVIYAGATILGRITIGRGSTIGGNVWLTHSVPPESNVMQAQIRTEVFTAATES